MKIVRNFKFKITQKIKRRDFIIVLVFSYILFVQFFSIFVSLITVIFMYLSSFSILLGLFFRSKLIKSITKNVQVENYKDLDDKVKEETNSKRLDRLLKNELLWIEFYESRVHQYICIKRKTSFHLVRFFLFISLFIIIILFTIMIKIVNEEANLMILNTISLIQYLLVIPLISTDLYINSGKTLYRHAKSSLNYFNKRIKLIYRNSKLRIDNYESLEIQVNIINDRIDDFNKLINPFSYYIKEFEVIAIFGIFFNVFLIANFEYFLIALLYLSILYLIYIVNQIKINYKLKRSELCKQIESDLDLLVLSLN